MAIHTSSRFSTETVCVPNRLCPRCHGSILLEEDEYRCWYLKCQSCAREFCCHCGGLIVAGLCHACNRGPMPLLRHPYGHKGLW